MQGCLREHPCPISRAARKKPLRPAKTPAERKKIFEIKKSPFIFYHKKNLNIKIQKS
jgi:hypothetical protein